MVLVSIILARVFIWFQLNHVKRHLNAPPFISLFKLLIITFGHMMPLILTLRHFSLKKSDNKSFVLGEVEWFEVNEIAAMLITMVAFLLQCRLLQPTWSARKANESQKGLWIAEKHAVYITLPSYAAWFLITCKVEEEMLSRCHSLRRTKDYYYLYIN